MSDIIIDRGEVIGTCVDKESSCEDVSQLKADVLAYKLEASVSATNASVSESNASISEDNASASEVEAEQSANDAGLSATNASNSAIASEGFKDEAELARDIAISNASDSSDSSIIATEQATIATSKANEANIAMNTATTQANISTAKANEASELKDQTGAIYQATSDLLDEFQGAYHGALSEAPLDNVSDNGDLYYDTNLNALMLRSSGLWGIAVPNMDQIYTKPETDVLLSNILTEEATYTNKTIDDYTNIIKSNAVHSRVKNQSGVTMTKGTVVSYFGYSDTEDAIKVVKANNTTGVAIGILNDDILADEFGMMTSTGIIDGLDTSSYTNGTILYTNTTGGLTDIEPTTGLAQPIAYVLKSNENIGVLQVLASYPKQDADDVRYDATNSVSTMISNLTTVREV